MYEQGYRPADDFVGKCISAIAFVLFVVTAVEEDWGAVILALFQ